MLLEIFKFIISKSLSLIFIICTFPFKIIVLYGTIFVMWLNGESRNKIKKESQELKDFFREEFNPFSKRINCLNLQQLKLYVKLKRSLKNNKLVYITKDDCRGIGKTTMLVKLAKEYDASIVVPTSHQKKIFTAEFPFIDFIVADESSRGKRLNCILFEEGIEEEIIYQVFIPMTKNFTGYMYR